MIHLLLTICLKVLILVSSNEALVIDAALNPQVYIDIAKTNGWSIKYVTDTHIHADYLSRTRELAKASMANHLLIDKAGVDFEFTSVEAGDSIKFGTTQLQFIHTPGHTWESTTLKIGDDALLTGDTLFVDGIGRPDLKAEREEAVKKASQRLRHRYREILRDEIGQTVTTTSEIDEELRHLWTVVQS